MPEYVPLKVPGSALTSQASAAVTGGLLLAVSGTGTVAPTSAASGSWVGMAAFDAAVNDKVTVHCGGVQMALTSAAVTAGNSVMAAAGGTVVPFTGTDYSQLVGVALTTAASGARVQVKFVR